MGHAGYFSSRDAVIDEYRALTKYQQVDRFWIDAEQLYDIVNVHCQNFLEVATPMQARAMLLENNDDVERFVSFLKSQPEFEYINGILLKSFLNLWFQGIRVCTFAIPIVGVTKQKVFCCKCCRMNSFTVEYQPSEEFGALYEVYSYPLFQVREDNESKTAACLTPLVLRR